MRFLRAPYCAESRAAGTDRCSVAEQGSGPARAVGSPRLINGAGGPSKTALPADGARRRSKNNQPAEAAPLPASHPNRLQLLKGLERCLGVGGGGGDNQDKAASPGQEAVIRLIRHETFQSLFTGSELTSDTGSTTESPHLLMGL